MIRPFQIRFESAQITCIDSEQGNLRTIQQDFQLRFRVCLAQRRHAEPGRNLCKFPNLLFLQHGGNQKNRIGAIRARFINLVSVEDEVFAQNRNRNRRADFTQIIQAAEKIVAFRQYGKCGGSGVFKLVCKFHITEIPADQPL